MTARINRTHIFLAALVVVLIGLFAPGAFGAGVLLLLAAGLAVLLVAGRRRHAPAQLAVRLLILVGLVVIAVAKLS